MWTACRLGRGPERLRASRQPKWTSFNRLESVGRKHFWKFRDLVLRLFAVQAKKNFPRSPTSFLSCENAKLPPLPSSHSVPLPSPNEERAIPRRNTATLSKCVRGGVRGFGCVHRETRARTHRGTTPSRQRTPTHASRTASARRICAGAIWRGNAFLRKRLLSFALGYRERR